MAYLASALQEAIDLIGALLPDDGEWHPSAPIYEAAKAAGISEATLWRASKALGIERQRLRQRHAPVYWRHAQLIEQDAPRSLQIHRPAA